MLRAWQKSHLLDTTNKLVESEQSQSCLQHNQHVPAGQKWSPAGQKWSPAGEYHHPPAGFSPTPTSLWPKPCNRLCRCSSTVSPQSQSAQLKSLLLGYVNAVSHWYDVAAIGTLRGMQFPFYTNNWDFRMYFSFQTGAMRRESTHLLPRSNAHAQMLRQIKSSV